jgi:hypothetical protein
MPTVNRLFFFEFVSKNQGLLRTIIQQRLNFSHLHLKSLNKFSQRIIKIRLSNREKVRTKRNQNASTFTIDKILLTKITLLLNGTLVALYYLIWVDKYNFDLAV